MYGHDGHGAALHSVTQADHVPREDVRSLAPTVDFLNNSHYCEKRSILASVGEQGSMTLQRKLDTLAIFSEPIHFDADLLLLLGEALAVAGLALVLYQLAMTLTSVALGFFSKQCIFLNALTFA